MIKLNFKTYTLLLLCLAIFSGCERDISDDAVLASFPNTAEVYTDNPVGLTDEFFISIDPLEGANPEAFGTDDNESFLGSSSIKIAVPGPNNPDGNFVGGIFRDRGEGRDLTGFDALTFWAKGSVNGTLSNVGFGNDFLEDKFPVVRQGLELTTDWKKYVVPIPNPSKLVQERGMFFFTAGGFDIVDDEPNGNEVAWTFWLDEIKFENLSTIGQLRPAILNGEDVVQQGFIDVPIELTGLNLTANLASGENVTVQAAPAYFDFQSTNPQVASVDETGLVSVASTGDASITASLRNIAAEGSLNLTVEGGFNFAPTPTRPAEDVVSIFSDAYQDIPVSRYNSFFEPFQTTLGGIVPVGPENIISYTQLNFVGIVFNDVTFPAEAVQPVDATNLTHLHIDINIQEPLEANDRFLMELTNFGASETVGSFLITGDQLLEDEWVSFDIPLSDFSGLSDRNRIGLLLFNSEAGPNNPTISNVFLDNIYFYVE
ncbi:Ig-like domain-containing protein [Flavobacteriaceae bacterium 14752]|uniref:Ig-like domain-containing protein n=1 Tax=Mesohalobacter salilacus TaxID=2491711 RepID=UPI000F639607|nr:carbohydrate-binding protein [Flavobacteriaceae bacterium 14752]